MTTIDLNSPPPNHTYSVKVEKEETAGERHVRLFKDVVLFLVAVSFVVLIAGLCFHTVLWSPAATEEEKKWAMSVLSAAAGGIVGYLVRK